MQKLFSMFPRGAPGLALLLLRLFGGGLLVSDALAAQGRLSVAVLALFALCALALVAGIATPIAALLAAFMEAAGVYPHFTQVPLQSFAPIVIAMALMLLGPGAYSFDARLFGRRLMEFKPDDNSRSSTKE